MKTMIKFCYLVLFVCVTTAFAAGPSLAVKGTIRNHFYRPIRVAVRSDGTIAVADYHRKQIYLFDENRRFRSNASVPSSPLSVAFASDGSLYVGIQNDVLRMTTAGEITDRFSLHGATFVAPVDIAVAASGVYVVDRETHSISVCSVEGSVMSTFGSFGTETGKLRSPSGIAIDAETNELFVVDAGNSRVQVFSLNGEFQRAFGKHVAKVDSVWETVGAFAHAQCIAVDAQHRIYVTDSGLDHVQVFDANGSHLGFVGKEGHPSQRLRVPMGIAATAAGRLIVTSMTNPELREYSIDQMTSVKPEMEIPTTFGLFQNYPNPFNPTTSIRFALPTEGLVTLEVYDVVGREVRTLLDEQKSIGVHTVVWDGRDENGTSVSSGIYFYRIDVSGKPANETMAGKYTQTNKMLFIK